MPEVIGCTNCKRLLKEIVVLESDIDMAADEIERLTVENRRLETILSGALSTLRSFDKDEANAVEAKWHLVSEGQKP